jgi:hypothetical protein
MRQTWARGSVAFQYALPLCIEGINGHIRSHATHAGEKGDRYPKAWNNEQEDGVYEMHIDAFLFPIEQDAKGSKEKALHRPVPGGAMVDQVVFMLHVVTVDGILALEFGKILALRRLDFIDACHARKFNTGVALEILRISP